ncbi:hypothetical protein SAMN06265360_1026 [Haloechinothrix alba]|uniref:Uncharacterized protein n=1 Tax=Haloechinothrix alba TaxID=664784 RepID=A0A238VC43_9PSEU|nr:hypothetical protein [Haloechinothrix alba]SNR31617.1 hypothetical protein SAMN06265360_1026 [Haloechinothrix alba]
MALALEGFAGALALSGECEAAATLLGTATALRESAGASLPQAERDDIDRVSATARDALGEERFEFAYHHGTALDLDTARAMGLR